MVLMIVKDNSSKSFIEGKQGHFLESSIQLWSWQLEKISLMLTKKWLLRSTVVLSAGYQTFFYSSFCYRSFIGTSCLLLLRVCISVLTDWKWQIVIRYFFNVKFCGAWIYNPRLNCAQQLALLNHIFTHIELKAVIQENLWERLNYW